MASRDKQYREAWQARRKAGEHLCAEPGCKKTPAPFRAKCQHHLDLRRKNQAADTERKRVLRAWGVEKKKDAGICVRCNAKSQEGSEYCGYHAELAEELAQTGKVCNYCWREREPGHTRCLHHLQKHREYMRKYRGRTGKDRKAEAGTTGSD